MLKKPKYCTIYLITNMINNQKYIGYTSLGIEERKKQHQHRSTRPNNIKLYNAIRKYGWNNFIFEVLYQSKDKNHTLKIMEPFFIKEYDSFNNGYNCTEGGEGNVGWKPTEIQNKKNKDAIIKLYSDPNSVYNSLEYKNKHRIAMNTPEYKSKVLGSNNPSARKVISPHGIVYGTIIEASIKNFVHKNTIRRWCNTNYKGWSFAD